MLPSYGTATFGLRAAGLGRSAEEDNLRANGDGFTVRNPGLQHCSVNQDIIVLQGCFSSTKVRGEKW